MSIPDVVISYTQSAQVDEQGRLLDQTYLNYTNDICERRWLFDYTVEGNEELKNALSIKNTIPNVSAVVFKRDKIRSILQANLPVLKRLRVAGDWLIYSELLTSGKIAFSAESLNFHRRHDESVTLNREGSEQHMAEILYMQSRLARRTDPDDHVLSLANRFALHAFEFLGLKNERYASPDEHPGVRSQFEKI